MAPEKKNQELLIALLPKTFALERLKNERWYHIPVESAPKRWPPQFMAFYQGRAFEGKEQNIIRYYGEIQNINVAPRGDLFSDDEENRHKAENLYYRIQMKEIQIRTEPIVSYRPRRLAFIPTTLEKFNQAVQINDLFDGSPLEDDVWLKLKGNNILAERQWKLVVRGNNYYLDFAVFCNKGKLAVETDGYITHFDSRNQIDYDTWRQNEIQLSGWRFLHYTTKQVQDDSTLYLSQIQTAIDQLGGLQPPEQYKHQPMNEQSGYIVDGEDPF